MMPPRLRIYCETLPYAELTKPAALALLKRYKLEIVLALRPWEVSDWQTSARVLRDAGVPFSLWPMLGDEEGRWASVHNAAAFVSFARSVLDALDDAKLLPNEVLLDLEPPFAYARALAVNKGGGFRFRDGFHGRMDAARRRSASGALAAFMSDVHARGISTASAVWPLVALDPARESGWQTFLGTPVDALCTSRVSVMMYSSILEGWSRRVLDRRDAVALLFAAAVRSRRRWETRSGMSLGCVGTGALVEEPVYRNPSELAEDVAYVRAAGCDDLSLFDLGGVLARPPAEAWLDAFAFGVEIAQPIPSLRVHALRRLARIATWTVARR